MVRLNKSTLKWFLFIFFLVSNNSSSMYICTCADDAFFPRLLNFIGSVHKTNFDEIEQIAIFNLGFKQEQIEELERIEKVCVYEIEMVHPDLLKHFVVTSKGKRVRGWYAWKPVAIKQALDMFPYILYSDAGSIIMGSLSKLFKHIKQKGYFFVDCECTIHHMAPRHVVETFSLDSSDRKHIWHSLGMAGGFMGLSRAMYDDFVLPMYNLAYDIRHFVDDGTTPDKHFGSGRHDQVLFGIHARLLGLEINRKSGHLYLDGKRQRFSYGSVVKFWATSRRWKQMRRYIRYKTT